MLLRTHPHRLWLGPEEHAREGVHGCFCSFGSAPKTENARAAVQYCGIPRLNRFYRLVIGFKRESAPAAQLGTSAMFRTKKKSSASARKRPAVADEEEAGEPQQPVRTEPGRDADAAGEPSLENQENDSDGDAEAALVERMRKRKHKPDRMTFSSTRKKTTSTVGTPAVAEESSAVGVKSGAGLLSFEDEESGGRSTKTKKTQRSKIKPNLLPRFGSEEEEQQQAQPANLYSTEMLESLRKEQKVLIKNEPTTEQVDVNPADVDATLEEDQEMNAKEEEYIPLQSKMMQDRKKKNRVTFGFHSDERNMAKSTEVEDPSEDEEDEQNRQWEEELMRRGGHHAPPVETKRAQDAQVYPSRKRMNCISLQNVMDKFRKTLDATTEEQDRAQREVARIDADASLIEQKLQQQRQELLKRSEEFEYFQVIEDYVKGLSFCLREKILVIEAKERELACEWSTRSKRIHDREAADVYEEIRAITAKFNIASDDFTGLDPGKFADEAGQVARDQQYELARAAKFRQGYRDMCTTVSEEEEMDIFADAIDDMNSLDHVYSRFQEWKGKFPEIYKSSYCDLALGSLYAPYVRAELLFWDPLGISSSQNLGHSWDLESFAWFVTLRQHISQSASTTAGSSENHVAALIRNVVLEKVRTAVSGYFDPCSALHTHSLVLLVEELVRHDFLQHCEASLRKIIDDVLARFSSQSKSIPLLAMSASSSQGHDQVLAFARYQLGQFSALQENLLTLFVVMPKKGPFQGACFRAVMQVLHQLLAYLNLCQQRNKTLMVAEATSTIRQLTSSAHLQAVLSLPKHQQEFQRLMALFAPFL